ncbi:hypothetical protein BQ8482_350158 [Mesorhizobium delmotii]|uniref:Uncharacterized protein n=1 Tax=Mesorhizobium delmotii TaxID=1631247 RepID=A0A2P9AQS5_9HYPH|nr:hypothetical protein BQ8482_350158 [Mesorhizobium delmotii]
MLNQPATMRQKPGYIGTLALEGLGAPSPGSQVAYGLTPHRFPVIQDCCQLGRRRLVRFRQTDAMAPSPVQGVQGNFFGRLACDQNRARSSEEIGLSSFNRFGSRRRHGRGSAAQTVAKRCEPLGRPQAR